jgi:hypothetical protein
MRDAIDSLLRQAIDVSLPYEKVVEQLIALAGQCQLKMNAPPTSAGTPAIVGSAGAAPPTVAK